MHQSRDLKTIIAELKALIARSDVGPDQKEYVEVALKELKQLRRRPNPTQAEVFFCVRRVAESLLSAFYKE
jgi:hypothetical protein